jgi:FdhE protein
MSIEVEYGPEFVKRAAADLLAVRPSYGELIGFYGDLFAAQEEARPRVRVEPFLLPPDLLRVKLRDKFPLTQVAEMRFDPEASATLFEDLCRIAVERRSGLSEPAAVLLKHAAKVVSLFQGFLGGEEAQLKQAADGFGVGPDALSWEKGYCPICGSPPALARLETDGHRFLFCSFCWHRWPARRTVCPFCDTVDPGRLSYQYSEEEKEYRLDLCDACRKYVKTVDSRQMSRLSYPPLEQIASLHLDIKAAEAGYETGSPATPPV